MRYRALQATCVLSVILCAPSSEAADSERIGIYHWGGQLTTSMSSGVERIASLGGHVARVVYAPTYYSDYGIQGGCYSKFSLSSLAQEPDVQRALDNRDVHTFILTAYDGTTFGDCQHQKFLSPGFYSEEHRAALKAEYSDFVLYLFRRYADSGRRFVISNWESDNAVYCGAAYGYAVDTAFRAGCDAHYSEKYEGNADPQQSLLGLRLWFETREEGIAEGLARGHALGLTGFEVLHAPEINIVRTLNQAGYPSVLRDVLSVVHASCVSYSSYESLNRENAGATLAEDISTIRQLAGAPGVIVGEAGYSRVDPRSVDEISAALKMSLQSGVLYFIYWNLNDQDSENAFGLFDLTDGLTPTGQLFARVLRNGL